MVEYPILFLRFRIFLVLISSNQNVESKYVPTEKSYKVLEMLFLLFQISINFSAQKLWDYLLNPMLRNLQLLSVVWRQMELLDNFS